MKFSIIFYYRFIKNILSGNTGKIILSCVLIFNSLISLNAQRDERLVTFASFDKSRPNSTAVSYDNRVFAAFPNRGDSELFFPVVEFINGSPIPYPNKNWNRLDGKKENRFYVILDLFIDNKNKLWVLDGLPAPKGSIVSDGKEQKEKEGYFKLVKIDLSSDKVERIYHFEDINLKTSGINDIVVDTDKNLAYLSDPGEKAVVILDLTTGKTRSVLKDHFSTTADPDLVLQYKGVELRNQQGKAFISNVNGIALTNDFKYFYYKPVNKLNLYRIETKYLSDPKLQEQELESHVEDLGPASITHGMIADDKGNIYLTSSTDYSIKYFSPDGTLHTLVQDERLIWPDSLGIGSDGYLYIANAQFDRLKQWHNGKAEFELPFTLLKIKLPE